MPTSHLLPFALVCALLRAASWVARWGRARQRGRGLRGGYRLAPASQVFGFDGPFDYETLAAVPEGERYQGAIAVAKALVVAAMRVPLPSGASWTDLAAIDSVYRWLGVPWIRAHTVHGELDDATFLRLRLDGPHAHWVRRDGDGWIVDYRDLLAGLPVRDGFALPPCALGWTAAGAWIEVDGERIAQGSPRWAFAKRRFHTAELHVHELVSHLLWTHLHAEAVAVSITEHLGPTHPIRRLLAPHYAFSLQANHNSGRVLMGGSGLFARVFSSGWPGAAELLRRGEAAWTYARMVPSRDVEARGVGQLPSYPWRDDAEAVWSAVEAHVRRHVDASCWDAPARAWTEARHARDGDRGWPACHDLDTLVEIVTACLFLVVRHAFVNAEQYAMFAYPPAWSPSARITTSGELVDELPTVGETLDIARATFAFSIQFNRLALPDADPRFVADLDAIGQAQAARAAQAVRPFWRGQPHTLSGSINA